MKMKKTEGISKILINILQNVDELRMGDLLDLHQDFLKGAIAEESFPGMFFANCRDEEIAAYIRSVLEK